MGLLNPGKMLAWDDPDYAATSAPVLPLPLADPGR